MSLHEWLLAILVIVIAATFGFVLALLAGVVGGCVLLALSMGPVGIVRRRYDSNEGPSSLQRSEEEMQVLAAWGSKARVLELGGFIFFGSAYQLYTQVKELVEAKTVSILVIDFSALAGIDSSAVATLVRTRLLISKAGLRLIMSGLNTPTTLPLRTIADPLVAYFATLDEAVEAAENAVLAIHGPAPVSPPPDDDWLVHALGDATLARQLTAQLCVRRYHEGEVLCRQGEDTDTLLFIDSGRIRVTVEEPGQPPMRVRVFGPHTIAGELAFFLGIPRTATLSVEREASVGTLDRATFQRLRHEHPELTMALLNYLVRVQAERLSFSNRQVVALRR
jgi:SulP family sulfate permease